MFYLNAKDVTVSATRQADTDLEISSVEDLLNKVGSQTLIQFYNRAVPSAPVKKFVNRSTAATRTYPLMESMARTGEYTQPEPIATSKDAAEDPWELPPPSDNSGSRKTGAAPDDSGSEAEEADVATATRKKGAKGAKTKQNANGAKRGRAPGLAGSKLVRVGEENPCRDGGIRAKAWDLVPAGGISYEKFIEKGGNPAALAFNIRQGRTKVVKG